MSDILYKYNIETRMKEHQLKTRWRTDVLIIYRCERCISSKNVCTRIFISNVAWEFYFHFRSSFWTGPLFSSRCSHLQPKAWFLTRRCCGRSRSPQQRPQSHMTSSALQTTARRCRRGDNGDVNNVLIPLICSYDFFFCLCDCLWLVFYLPSNVFMLSYVFHNVKSQWDLLIYA